MTATDGTADTAPAHRPTTVLPEGLPAPIPMPDGLDVPYWDGLKRHEVVVQRCQACDRFRWGPEHICHRCLSFDLEWAQVEPVGTVYSWVRVWHPTFPAVRDAVPYLILLVEVANADGVRLMGNLVGRDDPDIAIGLPVQGHFEDHTGPEGPYTLLHWEIRRP